MLRFLRSGMLACSLLALPSFVSAQTSSVSESSGLVSPIVRLVGINLRDFAGEWVFRSNSVGGLSGADATGNSIIVDGQVSINRDGQGFVNYAAGVIYTGTPGTVDAFTVTPGQAFLTITITDPIHGVGTVEITNLGRSYTQTVNFIAIRNKEGRIIRFVGHRTSVAPETATLTHYTFERQYQ